MMLRRPDPTYIDDGLAVQSFAIAMTGKMIQKQQQGYHGWETASVEYLWKLLKKHIKKGDPVDIANFAMMIWHRDSKEGRAP